MWVVGYVQFPSHQLEPWRACTQPRGRGLVIWGWGLPTPAGGSTPTLKPHYHKLTEPGCLLHGDAVEEPGAEALGRNRRHSEKPRKGTSTLVLLWGSMHNWCCCRRKGLPGSEWTSLPSHYQKWGSIFQMGNPGLGWAEGLAQDPTAGRV